MTDDAHAQANAEQVRLLREALTGPEPWPGPATGRATFPAPDGAGDPPDPELT